jgi:nitrogen fixation protein FixH
MNELTGRHVFLMIAGGFTVIIAVNVALAVAAVRTFPGLEVKNSYVASQSFDADRAAQDALGWEVALTHEAGRLTLRFEDASGSVRPELVSAVLGRTTHVADDLRPDFAWDGRAFVADVDLGTGIWAMRLRARAEDGTPFQRRLEIRVRP